MKATAREPEVFEEAQSDEQAARYDSLLDRAETIRELIVDGTLDPVDGLALVIWPTEAVEAAQEARRLAEERATRRRFSQEAREQALALVAGGATFRTAASAALGHERYRMSVWRWFRAKQKQVRA